MDLHVVGADERSRAALEYLEPQGWEVYGSPSATVLDMLRLGATSAGVSLTLHPAYVAGFLRLEPV